MHLQAAFTSDDPHCRRGCRKELTGGKEAPVDRANAHSAGTKLQPGHSRLANWGTASGGRPDCLCCWVQRTGVGYLKYTVAPRYLLGTSWQIANLPKKNQ